MKPIIFSMLFVLAIACNCPKNEKQNNISSLSESEHLVGATNWFQKSAEMRACYYQTFRLAKMQLQNNLNNYKGEKPTAVVLDIDETILDNSPFEVHLINTGQLYTSSLWKQWTDKSDAKALPGALEFTLFAKEIGVEVIYISNRKVNELPTTITNMLAFGFPNADSSFVFLKKNTSDKTERRNNVSAKYEVLLYVGDNLTDFSQDYGERDTNLGFKTVDETKELFGDKYIILPNPMYGEWEGAIYNNDYSLSAEEKRNLRKEILKGY